METQTLFILILVLLTANLLLVGVYIVFVLKEVRTSIGKLNNILATVDKLTEAVASPIIGISGALTGVTEGMKIIKAFRGLRKNVKKAAEGEE